MWPAMSSEALSLEDVSRASGFSPRAIRFYIQRKLIPPPRGVGRGNHYDAEHVERLRKLAELQTAGHSLDAIGRIFAGDENVTPASGAERPRARPMISAALWTRVVVADGVELHFDATQHPDVAKLMAIRGAVQRMLSDEDVPENKDEQPPDHAAEKKE